jgi:hypothetical protein
MDLEQEKTINSILQEYLTTSGYPLSLETFEKETESKGLALSSTSKQAADEAKISNIQVSLLLEIQYP